MGYHTLCYSLLPYVFFNKFIEMSYDMLYSLGTCYIHKRNYVILYSELNLEPRSFCYSHMCILLSLFLRWFASTFKSTYWHCPWLFTWPECEGEMYEEEEYKFVDGEY